MPVVATDPSKFLSDPSHFLSILAAGNLCVIPGQEVNAAELAKVIGITWRVLERWIGADARFPVLQRGRTGEPWRFDLVAVSDYLINKARSLSAGKEARLASNARLAGFAGADGAAPSPEASGGPGTVAAQANANDFRGFKALAETQMITHRLKQMQGDYVRADVVMALLLDLMTTMQTETLAITAKLDPAGQWPAEHRAAVEAEMRTVLVVVRDKLDASLEEWRKGASA